MNTAPHCCIIGAGPGIGHALALAFGHEGFNVSLLSRRPETQDAARAELRAKTGREMRAYGADAGSEASLRAGIGHARKDLGDISVLIYNAASFQIGRPTTVTSERLLAEFQANVGGALVAAKAVAPFMREKKRGTILFTGGGFAYEPSADYASLSLGKAALRSLSYTLAQELGADGIHVATVTVHGYVQPGTQFDPHRIAQAYIALHRQPKGHFDLEKVYK